MQILSWLFQSCDTGVSSQELKGKKPWQLESPVRDKAIDKDIGKRAWALCYLSGVKDRYPFKEDPANS